MSRIPRVPIEDLAEGELALTSGVGRYLTRVLRLGDGDRFEAFDPGRALEADGEVVAVEDAVVRCRIGAPRPATAVATRPVTLLQVIGKGDKIETVVRNATALGATRLVVVESERSVVQLDERGPRRRDRWRQIAIDAARQCGRGDVPTIDGPQALAAALEGAAGGPLLCLQPGAETSLVDSLEAWDRRQTLHVLVGPEGGFSDEELTEVERRATLVRFGSFVLRTELASTAVLAVIATLP